MKGSLMDKILRWGCVVGKGEPLSCFFVFFFANLQAKPRFFRVKKLNCFHEESKAFECWWAAEERRFEGPSMSQETLSPVAAVLWHFRTNRDSGKFPVGEEIWGPVKKRRCFKLGVEFLWLLGSDCTETTLVVLKSLSESEPHTADLDSVWWRERGKEGTWVVIRGSGTPHSLLQVPILSDTRKETGLLVD